jgi:hypothetical protein
MMTDLASSVQLSRLLKSLHEFDKLEFENLHKTTCPVCRSGTLHQACYPRKLRGFGLGDSSIDEFSLRFSLCCSSCRRRTTPVSALFAGRFVYSTLVLFAAFLWPRRCERLRYPTGITKRRWKKWWRDSLSTRRWTMRVQAVNCAAHLPLRELILSLKRVAGGPPDWTRVLTFHPEILWGYSSRKE